MYSSSDLEYLRARTVCMRRSVLPILTGAPNFPFICLRRLHQRRASTQAALQTLTAKMFKFDGRNASLRRLVQYFRPYTSDAPFDAFVVLHGKARYPPIKVVVA